MTPANQKKAKYSVRQWGEIIFGENTGLSTMYLSDNSVPWSRDAFDTVLRPWDTSEFEDVISGDSLCEIVRSEIIGEIAAFLQRAKGKHGFETPLVHFRGWDAHVTIRDEVLLEAIWRDQPVFRGQRMKLLSKGFFEKDITVYKIIGARAMRISELVASLPSNTKDMVALIKADMYQVEALSGQRFSDLEPIFNGNMLIFGKPGFEKQKTFLGESFVEVFFPRSTDHQPSLPQDTQQDATLHHAPHSSFNSISFRFSRGLGGFFVV